MVRPSNSRLRRATYVQDGAGPMKAGLAPTVGKNHHFFRIKRTVGGPKCCIPAIVPELIDSVFDPSNGLKILLKFDNIVTIDARLDGTMGETDDQAKNKTTDSTFRGQFSVMHHTTYATDVSFVGMKKITPSKAYIHDSDTIPSSAEFKKTGMYVMLELDAGHAPTFDEKYVIEYTPASDTNKNYRLRRAGGKRGVMDVKQKIKDVKASNKLSFDLSGVTATALTTIEIEFTDNIKLKGSATNIKDAFSIYDISASNVAIEPETIVANGDGKKVTLTFSSALTASKDHKISYDPSRLSDTNAKDNFLFADNSDSVQNYRIKEISEQTFTTPAS